MTAGTEILPNCTHRALKAWRCSECGRRIRKGEQMRARTERGSDLMIGASLYPRFVWKYTCSDCAAKGPQ